MDEVILSPDQVPNPGSVSITGSGLKARVLRDCAMATDLLGVASQDCYNKILQTFIFTFWRLGNPRSCHFPHLEGVILPVCRRHLVTVDGGRGRNSSTSSYKGISYPPQEIHLIPRHFPNALLWVFP